MKTFPMLTLVVGALLPGSLLAQIPSAPRDWQPLGVEQTVDPIFPHRLLDLGVTTGIANVAVNTDATGKLVECLVVGYTQPEFAEAAVTAIKQWKFDPARLHGQPVGTIAELVFNFEARGVVVSSVNLLEQFEGRLMRMTENRFVYRPRSLRELDRAPVATVTVAPRYPSTLAERGVKGTVTIDFFIDETGAVRMPAASANEDFTLTALAIDALSQWKFTPPTSHGRGVLVKASQEFHFRNGG
ncbi:MAG TPA: TonB family protein [Opitutaceae bacterium]|nr:TonB family protein [Opitutaceae bacterium]